MKLDDNQRQAVAKWIAEGAKLSEIQNRLAAEFGVKLTYMEARFLVDDLKLTPKDPEPPKVVEPPVAPAAAKPLTTTPIPADVEPSPAGPGVTP
jgi:transposase